MTTTTATTYGGEYSEDTQAEGIIGYLDGGDYSPDQRDALTAALMSALVDEVDERLPEGTFWHPSTSEFTHPVGAEIPDEEEMAELFSAAWDTVAGRFDEIEEAVLPVLPVQAVVAELPDEPIERARAAKRLIDEARTAQETFSAAYREAIYRATRRGMTYAQVADELGVSAAAVNKAITEHGRR